MGIRPGGEGNITKSRHIAWHHGPRPAREASYVPSPVADEAHFYIVSDLGFVSCYDAKTGKRFWMEKLGKRHSASGLIAGGHVYFTSDKGETFVLNAGEKYELLAKNELGEECNSSPAAAQGQLFIRTGKHLWCVGSPRSAKK
jgi:hypothetical protein